MKNPVKLASIQGVATFSFNKAALTALAEFPALVRRKIAFIDGDNDFATVSARPERGMREFAKDYVTKRKSDGPMAVRQVLLSQLKIARFVYFVDRDDILDSIADKTARNIFLFDHEVGHFVTKHGRFPVRFMPGTRIHHPIVEAAADVYAALRHMQRNGSSRAIDGLSWERACGAFTGDFVHFTTIALDKVLACDPAILSTLAPVELARLADRFAAAYTPPDATLETMLKLSKEMMNKSRQSGLEEEDFRKMAEATVMQEKDPWLFYAGAAVFRRLAGASFSVDGHDIELTEAFWEKVADRIYRNEKPFENYRNAVPDQPVLEDFLAEMASPTCATVDPSFSGITPFLCWQPQ